MNFNSSQCHSLSFVSSQHNTHDESWLLPGVTSTFFCFACTIEGLEDKSILKIRKKKIAAELLQVLLVNKNIGKIIASKQDVYFHLLNLFVNLLSVSVDQEFSDMVNQCCLLTVKETNPLHAARIIIENVIKRKGFSENLYFVKLLCSLLQLTPSISDELFKKNGIHIEEIIQTTSTSNNNNLIYLWNLISLILDSGLKNSNNHIPKDVVQLILVNGLDVINTSSVSGVEIHILHCLQCFSESKHFRAVLYDHECSKLTSNTQSIVEVLKKMLLSNKEDLELNAVRCISSICDPHYEAASETPVLSSLVSLVLERGLSEFLLELLASAGETVVVELFKCLCKLTYSKSFCKMGHMVYGFSAIIKAIVKVESSSNLEAFCQGIILLQAMLAKEIFLDHRNHLPKQNNDILNILNIGFSKPLSKLKYILVSCFCVYLNHVQCLTVTDYETCFNLIESMFSYVEKDVNIITSNVDKNLIEFIVHTYECVYKMTQIICKETTKSEKNRATQETTKSSGSSQLSQCLDNNVLNTIADNIYYLCDKYLIPQAVMKFLPLKNLQFQSVFYRTLLSIIELSQQKGKLLAFKAAESSFIKMIFDFKVLASRTGKDINEILAKLLLYLCLAAETYLFNDWLQECLMGWFTKFNIPFNEWKFLLIKSSLSDQMTNDYLSEARSCVFALLAYSHNAGTPLISITVLKSHLENFAESKESLLSLPILGKRYFLYLWCQIESLQLNNNFSDIASKHVVNMLEAESERVNILYMNTEHILIWILKNNISLQLKISFFELFFDNFVKQNECPDKFKILVTNLTSHGLVCKFVEVLLSSLGGCSNNMIIEELVSAFIISLNSVNSMDLEYFKTCIYKSFMVGGSAMEHFHTAALFKCSTDLQVACGREINDDDLKLFCKSLSMISEHCAPSLKFQLLRYISIVIIKSVKTCNAKPSSVILGKTGLILDFETSVFTNRNFIMNSQSSCLLENINAVIIIIVAELLSGFQLLAVFSNDVIKVQIDVFIDALACPIVPVIQIATLLFWKKVFELKFQSPLIEFIDDSGNTYIITQRDICLIYIALQNLCYNPKDLIREGAVDCLCTLIDNLSSPDFLFNQPWTKTLICICLEKLSFEGKDIASLKLLSVHIKYKETCDEATYNVTMKMLKQCMEEHNIHAKAVFEIIQLAEVVIKVYVGNIDYSILKELKAFLKSLHHKFCKDTCGLDNGKINFISINGLLIVKEDINSIQALEWIRETKIAVCERISSIDNETDSGDDGD